MNKYNKLTMEQRVFLLEKQLNEAGFLDKLKSLFKTKVQQTESPDEDEESSDEESIDTKQSTDTKQSGDKDNTKSPDIKQYSDTASKYLKRLKNDLEGLFMHDDDPDQDLTFKINKSDLSLVSKLYYIDIATDKSELVGTYTVQIVTDDSGDPIIRLETKFLGLLKGYPKFKNRVREVTIPEPNRKWKTKPVLKVVQSIFHTCKYITDNIVKIDPDLEGKFTISNDVVSDSIKKTIKSNQFDLMLSLFSEIKRDSRLPFTIQYNTSEKYNPDSAIDVALIYQLSGINLKPDESRCMCIMSYNTPEEGSPYITFDVLYSDGLYNTNSKLFSETNEKIEITSFTKSALKDLKSDLLETIATTFPSDRELKVLAVKAKLAKRREDVKVKTITP